MVCAIERISHEAGFFNNHAGDHYHDNTETDTMSDFYILTKPAAGHTKERVLCFSEETAGFVPHIAFATPYPNPEHAAQRAKLFNLECDVSGVSVSVTHHERHCFAQPGRRGLVA